MGKAFKVIWLKFCLEALFTGKKAIDASILENFRFYTGNGKPETVIVLRVFDRRNSQIRGEKWATL